MKMIKSINDIQQLLTSGFADWREFGNVYVREFGDLRIFNYTRQAQFGERWNYFETVSRGLILNAKTGEVVARPFDKFFNWGEGGRYSAAPIKSVTEKIDGSLGILYRDGGQFRIATRGSFDGEQALWATDFLQEKPNLDLIADAATLLFEIVYPENRVVVDYGSREDLVLLAIRSRFTGGYYPELLDDYADMCGFGRPNVYWFETPEQIIAASEKLSCNSEGWVVEFEDGQRYKFKGSEYRKLHKLISGLSFKNTLECVSGGTINELLAIVPEEFLEEVRGWVDEIQSVVQRTKAGSIAAFNDAPKSSRKEFALWVNNNCKPLSPYLFAMLDNREIDQMIYKIEFYKGDLE